ncbi:MAG: translation initiation factor IF-3 [Phycisphaerales bacterium]
MNHLIRITPVRVVGPENEQIGVVETSEALKMAFEKGMDLVEISPDARPPVCKIMDYGKYKYELSKQQKSKSGSKATEMKQVRLGRSVKIDPHDVQIRIDQSRKFLIAGHKVQFVQRFRGREITHRELGLDHLRECVNKLADISKVEQTPRWFGKEASIILAPDKVKIEAIKRKADKEKAGSAKPEAGAAKPEGAPPKPGATGAEPAAPKPRVTRPKTAAPTEAAAPAVQAPAAAPAPAH